MFKVRPEHLTSKVDPQEFLADWAGIEWLAEKRALLESSLRPGDELWQWSFGAYGGLVILRGQAIAEVITAVHGHPIPRVNVLKVHWSDQLTVSQLAMVRRYFDNLRDVSVVELRERLRGKDTLELSEYETQRDLSAVEKAMRQAGLQTELVSREE